jgi:glycine cleavage system pyridoxal-binding protein P
MTKYIWRVSDVFVDAIVVAPSPEAALAAVEGELILTERMSDLIAREHVREAEIIKLGVVTADVDFDSDICVGDGVTLGVQVLSFG